MIQIHLQKKTEVSDEKGVFNDTGALGVIVEGKYYAFSLEEGIENYYDIEDSYYYTISLNFFRMIRMVRRLR